MRGSLAPATAGAGAVVVVSGAPGALSLADATGAWIARDLPAGTYVVTPRRAGVTFTPASRVVTVPANGEARADFTAATGTAPAIDLPDLSVLVPPGSFAIAGSGDARELQYTHLTFNGGTGPLVIQPQYLPATGKYLGRQDVRRWNGSGWTLAYQAPIAGAFEFHAAHGHFHFPFAAFGLYSVAANGGPGAVVDGGHKAGFCIADSYLYDAALPHARLEGFGSCSDPLALRGVSVGGVDEYDRTDDGQSLPLAGVPDGTYWVRAVVDPDGFIEESDETDNETDVKIAIAGGTVHVLETRMPVLGVSPAVTLTAPADLATLSGTVHVSATAAGGGLRFLLDGDVVATGSGSWTWDTRTATNGAHWLAAQAIVPGALPGTSAVARVTVANPDTAPPSVRIDYPDAGDTVSASVAVGATVASAATIARVRFLLDGAPLGAAVATPPYIVTWDTRPMGDGVHVLAAIATDAGGREGRSADLAVVVDNTHPPDRIVRTAVASGDGVPPVATAAFAVRAGDYVVAFVALAGPVGQPQAATVEGAGLAWTLLERSNVEPGTAEVWAARADAAVADATVTARATAPAAWGSITAIAFARAAGSGVLGRSSAPSGPPDLYLPGVAAGSWVHAVGVAAGLTAAPVPVAGQELSHVAFVPGGGAAWVQSTTAPSEAFALVDVRDVSPATVPWNLAGVEIVATRCNCDTEANLAPHAALDASPAAGPAPLTVRFSAAGSTDADRDGWEADWSFGDGAVAAGIEASHTYAREGEYRARVVVRDVRGAADTAAVTIVVGADGRAVLSHAWPNPARTSVSLRLVMARDGDVGFRIVDATGREVWAAPSRRLASGEWALDWDGRSADGPAPSGVYFARVRAAGAELVRRFAIVR